jgi:GNAT superfamily N-acetyltransferase
MSQPIDSTALARRLEANEIAAWRSIFQAPAPDVAAKLGLGYVEQAGALLIWNRAAPVAIYNRLLALGVFEPAADAAIDALLERSRAEQARCSVQIAPVAQPANLGAKIAARGLRPDTAWLMHYRALEGRLPDPAPPPGYRVERVTPDSAAAWSDAILAGWQVPARAAAGVLATLLPLAQQPDWACYLAIHEATGLAVGGGALFVGGGVGGLYTDGVRAGHRGHALQRALIAARLAEARERGCDLASAQTYVASAGQRNMAQQGFEVAYTRQNYVMPK